MQEPLGEGVMGLFVFSWLHHVGWKGMHWVTPGSSHQPSPSVDLAISLVASCCSCLPRCFLVRFCSECVFSLSKLLGYSLFLRPLATINLPCVSLDLLSLGISYK
jgi:hypothetical protein